MGTQDDCNHKYSFKYILNGLIVLLIANLALSFFMFKGLNLSTHLLSYGNLAPVLLNGSTSTTAFGELQVYTLSAYGISLVAGPFIAQNLTYALFIILLSVSAFFLILAFTESRTVAVVSSLTFATVLNPLFFTQLLGGSFFLFPFVFLVFLTMLYLVNFSRTGNSGNILVSGVFYGLAISNYFPNGFFISILIVAAFLLLGVMHHYKTATTRLKAIALFSLPFSLLAVPVALLSIFSVHDLLTNSSLTHGASSYVLSTIQYEFKDLGIEYAILNGLWEGPLLSFYTTLFWYSIVALSLTFGVLSFFVRLDDYYIYYRINFVIYAIFTTIIILFRYELITSLFLKVKIFDDMDYPEFYQLAQDLSLLFLFSGFLKLLLGLPEKWFKRESSLFNPVVREKHSASKIVERSFGSRTFKNVTRTIIVVFFVWLLLANSISYTSTVNSYVNVPSNSIPYYFNSMHNWYSTNNVTGKILILPNSSPVLPDMQGFIPIGAFWNPPIPLPSESLEYNSSLYLATLSSLNNANLNYSAYLLGLSGVQYIIIDTGYRNVTIIPSTAIYNYQYLAVNQTILCNSMSNSSRFSLSFKNSNFAVFRDLDYSSIRGSKSVSIFPNLSKTAFPATNISMLNQTVMNTLNEWPSNRVDQNGTTFLINVPNGSNIDYTVLGFHFNLSRYLPPEYLNSYTIDRFKIEAGIDLLNNSGIDTYVLFYNNYSSGYWQEIQQVSTGNFNKNSTMNTTVQIPKGVVSMNVVFQTGAVINGSALAKISNISIDYVYSPVINTSYVQYSTYHMLQNDGVSFVDSLYIPDSFLASGNEFTNYSKEIILFRNPLGNLSILNSNIKKLLKVMHGYESSIFFISSESGNFSNFDISIFANSKFLGDAVPIYSVYTLYYLNFTGQNMLNNLSIDVNNSSSIALMGLIITPVNVSNSTIRLVLPYGGALIESTHNVLTLERIFNSASGQPFTLTLLSFVPLFSLIGLCSFFIAERHRKSKMR